MPLPENGTKLATSLAAAYHTGVLKDLLDEWGVAGYAQRRIYESIRAHWLDRVERGK